jgi:perosamine synthetase
MIAKLPIIKASCSSGDLVYALAHVPCAQVNPRFKTALAVMLEAGIVHTLSSGLACFYEILEVLKIVSTRKEVVLPAYTAGSLIVAVRKSGLKPVLCDISLNDFNADRDGVRSALSDNTLAVVAVHMFGIPIGYMDALKAALPDGVFLIEDCCQAMGCRIKDKPAGSFGDISFFSFNRGKNLSANNGGCIIVRTGVLEEPVRVAMKQLSAPGCMDWTGAFFKTVLFMIGTDPYVYAMGYGLASGFRETAPPDDVPVRLLGNFQSALGVQSLRKAEASFFGRYRNGMALLQGFEGASGFRLPAIGPGIMPVFNRLPILFDDVQLLERAQMKLWRNGIESSTLYIKPLHHMFDLGYAHDDFPNACFLAEHLLTLPVHPGVSQRHIKIIVDTIRGLV